MRRWCAVVGLVVLSAGIARGEEQAATPTAEPPGAATSERIGDAWHDPRNPIVKLFGGKRLDLWSLRPIKRAAPPDVEREAWVRHPIDRFVLARIEQSDLAPSAEADRRTLARRLYFGLTGLPPTADEMERFLADERPDAYERLVDELLESPRYGEHVARMWLDVVRYSDSNGFDWDEFRPRAWLFRDYVIRSLNADKPYDQFVREQLAGDELLDGPPQTPAERDMLLATTYLRLGPQDNSAALFNEQARGRAEWMADLVETTGSAFLGLTMACCRCHDHKYDPLSQADHFRMQAFFEGLEYADNTPIDLAHEQEAIRTHNADIERRIEPLRAEHDKLRAAIKDRLRSERVAQLSDDERKLLETDPDELDETRKEQREALAKKVEPSREEVNEQASDAEKERQKQLDAQIKGLEAQRRGFSHALLARDKQGDIPVTRILYQGDHKQEREAVALGFLSVLDPQPAAIAPPRAGTTGRRLALANWIVSPDNPLAARVIVNRLWQMHFGEGLVRSPNDFGLAGESPTHPELLDYLAGELIRNGWSLKQLQRAIVTSATYRQASAKTTLHRERDPDNRLLARQSLRRLSAEQLRDALLSVSGLLNARSSGPPIWPELPPEILQANPAFLDDNATRTKGWYPSPADEQHARTVFVVQKRTVKVPFLETFDLPENMVSCARRNTSTVAPQALSLLNSPLAIAAARSLAEQVQRDAGEAAAAEAQVDAAFRRALQRPPRAEQRAACASFLADRSLVELCRVLLNLNEFVYIE